MTQTSHDKQCKFLARCEEAYHLVQDFLHDRLPEVEKNPPFIFRQHQRLIVKEKVKKSLEVLDKALDSHRYVNQYRHFYVLLIRLTNFQC